MLNVFISKKTLGFEKKGINNKVVERRTIKNMKNAFYKFFEEKKENSRTS